ncbi:hypothetical protein NFC81_13365 [Salinispirillum sp. LH 10-3-1]|uniref:Uncharacterized protein n=1 Tax=Salinispirillum sp. LH 10-3-1 TaxID=2952525 RepID=A0AB38YEG2_9GAMM
MKLCLLLAVSVALWFLMDTQSDSLLRGLLLPLLFSLLVVYTVSQVMSLLPDWFNGGHGGDGQGSGGDGLG